MLRIVTSDGRVFIGTFVGTDQLLNVLLVNTEEYRVHPTANANPNGRFVGQVMIPWRLIMQVEAPLRKTSQTRTGNGIPPSGEMGALYI